MKTLGRCLASIGFLLMGSMAFPQPAPRFRVLLMGFTQTDAKVANRAVVTELPGDLDAQNMAAVLTSHFAVPASSMKILNSPELLHKADVVKALDSLAEEAGPDDIVIIYYSGHGAVFSDLSKGGRPSHGLMMGDTVKKGTEIDPKSMLIGPEIGRQLAKLNHVKNLTIIFDSCHASGSNRGDKGRFLEKRVEAPVAAMATDADENDLNEMSKGQLYTAIFACRAAERAYTDSEVGSDFTNALIQALSSKRYSSYKDLVDQADFNMMFNNLPRQAPYVEGDLTQPVFGSVYVETPSSFAFKVPGDGKIYVAAGRLSGVSNGALLAVFAPDDKLMTGTPKAFVKVSDAGNLLSEVQWEGPQLEKSTLGAMRAVVIDGVGEQKVHVLLPPEAKAALGVAKLKALAANPYIHICTSDAEARFRIQKDSSGVWELLSPANQVIERFSDDWMTMAKTKEDRRSLNGRLLTLAMAEAMMRVTSTPNSPWAVEIQLLAAKVNSSGGAVLDMDSVPTKERDVDPTDLFTYGITLRWTGDPFDPQAKEAAFVNLSTYSSTRLFDPIWPISQDLTGNAKAKPESFMAIYPDGRQYIITSSGLKPREEVNKDTLILGHTMSSDGFEDEQWIFKVFVTPVAEILWNAQLGGTRGGGPKSYLGNVMSSFAAGKSRGPKDVGDINYFATDTVAVRPKKLVLNPPKGVQP